jgi:hypothetical protein
VEGTSEAAVLGSSGQRKLPAGCCTGIFWPAEGTSQAVTISKKWENPSSALRRTRTCVHALLLYLVATNVPDLCSYLDRRWWMRLITLFPCLSIITYSKGRHGRFLGSFFHPSIRPIIHPWMASSREENPDRNKYHTPPPPMCCCLGKACPAPRFWYQYCRQFLVRVAFGVYLPSSIFYHGQLYVTISWVTSSANIKIFSGQGLDEYMQNVVYREVLET